MGVVAAEVLGRLGLRRRLRERKNERESGILPFDDRATTVAIHSIRIAMYFCTDHLMTV